MNKKLIAAAVSAAVMAPVAAQADVTLYGRIHNGIQIKNVSGYTTPAVAAKAAVPAITGTTTVTSKAAVPAVVAKAAKDVASVSNTDVRAVGSRFGIKASSDLGNGLTATANYEFAVATDKELNNSDYLKSSDLRLGTVGLSGGFGSVNIGNQWSAFYNTVGAYLDPTYTIGYNLYSSFAGGPYRASNTIQYTNSFGPVSLALDVRMNDSGESSAFGGGTAETLGGDGFGLGLNFAVSENLTLAFAYDSENTAAVDAVAAVAATAAVDAIPAIVGTTVGTTDKIAITAVPAVDAVPATLGTVAKAGTPSTDTDRTGLGVKYTAGGYWASLGWYEQEKGDASVEQTQLWVGTSFGDNTAAMIGFGKTDDGSKAEPSAVSIGVYHNMGGGFKLLYEGTSVDADNAISGKGDLSRHVFTIRLDF